MSDDDTNGALEGRSAPPAAGQLTEQLTEALGSLAEVVALRALTQQERDRVEELEREAQDTGAAGGMMAFVNEGVWEALAAPQVFAAVTGPMVDEPPRPWTIMLDEEDQLIGEWLPESRREEARANKACHFLSKDFVLYKDRRATGRSRFVMPGMEVAVPGEEGVAIVVGCPSTPADLYLRSLMGEPGPEKATLLMGVVGPAEAGPASPPQAPYRPKKEE